jgi:hypothetical protein
MESEESDLVMLRKNKLLLEGFTSIQEDVYQRI